MAEQYITHEPILEGLRVKYKNKKWNERFVFRWCQQIETLHIADPDSMWKYLEIPLAVTQGKFYLPDNLYKLLDVYDKNSNSKRVRYNRQGKLIKQLIDFEEDVIWINYIGTPMDLKSCMPLIDANHYIACETLCIINGFAEEAMFSQSGLNQNEYQDLKLRFDNQIQAPKSDMRNWGSQDFADMVIIMGDEIPKIGFQPLANNYTNNATIV